MLAIPTAPSRDIGRRSYQSSAIDVAKRHNPRAARHVETQRRAGERHHAVVESWSCAKSNTGPAIADRRDGIDAAKIVGPLIPGRQVEQKAAPAASSCACGVKPNNIATPEPKCGVARKTARRMGMTAGG